MPVIHEQREVERNIERLVRGAHILGVPAHPHRAIREGSRADGRAAARARSRRRAATGRSRRTASPRTAARLRARSIGRQALIAGVETHVCVYQTVLDLLGAGWSVWIAADAVSSRTPRNRDIALQRLVSEGAKLSSTEMALFELLVTCRDGRVPRDLAPGASNCGQLRHALCSHIVTCSRCECWAQAMKSEKRILVVDDDDAIRALLQTVLRRRGCRWTARERRRGAGTLGACRYALVVLDLMMPRMSGYEVLDALSPRIRSEPPARARAHRRTRAARRSTRPRDRHDSQAVRHRAAGRHRHRLSVGRTSAADACARPSRRAERIRHVF